MILLNLLWKYNLLNIIKILFNFYIINLYFKNKTPASSHYNIKGIFEIDKEKKIGKSMGVSREVI